MMKTGNTANSGASGGLEAGPKDDDPCDPWKSLTREKHPKGWTGRRADPSLSLDEGEGNAQL